MVQYIKDETKENFCGACVAIPLALAGGVGTVASAKSHKKSKKIILGISLSISIISLLVVAYLYFKRCKDCKFD